MSPRPRATTDEQLLAAAHRVVSRLGPNLTLADVAAEAGVSPATLVQRFGSKRGLLLAFVSSASGATGGQFAEIRGRHADPIEAIREVVRCYARMAPTPEAVSNGLAFLQIDMNDPEFHRHAHRQARDTLDELRRLLDAAVKAGRLAKCDTRRLARALHAVIGGSMVAWGVLREGAAEKWMLGDVETLLAPLIVKPRRR
ncbi:MAG TPA: TetR/AcrR family transcriptional regulator [Vicinamibacterales bacterium]|nr:TetR/AcrR family transcriptional regulator [Vicinamibacterales bacterium]